MGELDPLTRPTYPDELLISCRAYTTVELTTALSSASKYLDKVLATVVVPPEVSPVGPVRHGVPKMRTTSGSAGLWTLSLMSADCRGSRQRQPLAVSQMHARSQEQARLDDKMKVH